MYVKFVSMIMATSAAEMFVYGTQSPDDPLFLFISNSPLVQIVRLALAGSLVVLAYKGRFKYRISQKLALYGGILLAVAGSVSMCSQFLIDLTGTYIKFADFMLAAAVGFAFIVSALTLPAGKRKVYLPKTALYKLPKIFGPKLTHSQ